MARGEQVHRADLVCSRATATERLRLFRDPEVWSDLLHRATIDGDRVWLNQINSRSPGPGSGWRNAHRGAAGGWRHFARPEAGAARSRVQRDYERDFYVRAGEHRRRPFSSGWTRPVPAEPRR